MTDRIQQGSSDKIKIQLSSDGAPVDPTPDSATVHVVRADGTDVIAAGTAATDSGTGGFTAAYTAAHTALLDIWTATWTFTLAGQQQTRQTVHEIVGGHLFTLAEARKIKALEDTDKYPAEEIAAKRTYAEEELEDACGVAFVPRYAHERRQISRGWVILAHRDPRIIRYVSVDGGAPWTLEQLQALRFSSSGAVALGAFGFNVTIGYEHGLDRPPAGARAAALTIAKHELVTGPVDDRAIQRETEFGPISLATPGLRGARFGIPSVDAFVAGFDKRGGLA